MRCVVFSHERPRLHACKSKSSKCDTHAKIRRHFPQSQRAACQGVVQVVVPSNEIQIEPEIDRSSYFDRHTSVARVRPTLYSSQAALHNSIEMLALALACLTLHATPRVLPLRSSMMSGTRTSFSTRTEMVTNGGNRARVAVSLAMEKPTEASGDHKKGRFFLPVVFSALSVACALALGRTMSLQPLYPFKTDSLSWRE